MDYIAENRITITKELFYEGLKATESVSYRKMLRRMIMILSVVFLGVAGWMLYHKMSLVFLLGEGIFLGALLFWLAVALPGNRKKNKYKAICQSTSGAPERIVRFYQDHLVVITDTGKTTEFAYQQLQNRKETEHLYILIDKEKTGILLSKTGFTKGSFQDLELLGRK